MSDDVPLEKYEKCVVIFAGQTQHGKSTTIHNFANMSAGINLEHLVFGQGMRSRTQKATFTKPVPVHYVKYSAWSSQSDNLPVTDADWHVLRRDRMLADADYRASVTLGAPACSASGAGILFMMLDTPGAGDSHGRDDENMDDTLEKISEPETPPLRALVWIIKAGVPLTGTFMKDLARYWHQFPKFRSNWIFAHTNVHPYQQNYDMSRYYEEDCRKREEELIHSCIEHLGGQYEAELRAISHVFLGGLTASETEHRRNPNSAVVLTQLEKSTAEHILANRAKSYNDFIRTVLDCQPVHMSNLIYHKSSEQIQLDMILRSACQSRKDVTQDDFNKQKNKLACHKTKLSEIAKKVEYQTAQINMQQNLVDLDDNDELSLCDSKKACQNFSLWSLLFPQEGTYTLSAPHQEGVVKEITQDDDYSRGRVHNDEGLRQIDGGTEWTVTLKSCCGFGFGFHLKLYVQKRVKYADKIRVQQKAIEDLKVLLQNAEDHKHHLDAELQDQKEDLATAQSQIDFMAKVIATFDVSDLPLPEWRKMRLFYQYYKSTGQAEIATMLRKYLETLGMVEDAKQAGLFT